MIADPAVRSVRVAVALCDRFDELMKGPTVITAHKTRRALVGVKGNDDEFSLRVNQAQQIYPEIWSHLDDARKGFAARGIDMTGYDVLRENERQFVGTGAGIDMKYTEYGDPRYGYQQTEKRANFNTGGLQRARLAIQALQKATSDIDWAGIAKAEDNDPQAKAFRRATIIKRIWMFAILIALVGIPFWYVLWQRHEENAKREKWRRQSEQYSYQPPPPAPPPANALPAPEQKALLEKANQILSELQAASLAWQTATQDEELRKHKAGTESCALAVTAPPKEAADKYIKSGDVDDKAFASSAFFGYVSSDGFVPNTEVLRAANTAKRAIKDLEGGRGTPETRTTLDDLEKPVVFVLIDKDHEPQVNSFKPLTIERGKIAARGYVFDPRSAKVICAATLDLTGSDAKAAADYLGDIEDGREATEILHRELEVR
ncbi:MAG TPA: hypothetical protein VL326_17500, partial [Kofleriaceae bacterium]|nr:hypothetical protein [Kofleriaceae bacterium]